MNTETATIGEQVWMRKNLDVVTFKNGTSIPLITTPAEWLKASQSEKPACCYVNFDPGTAGYYGLLYNWFAVNDARGLAPEGWHIPSLQEWRQLTDTIGRDVPAYKLKSRDGWPYMCGGNNESGFSALPAGLCSYGGGFVFTGDYGFWWSSSASGQGTLVHAFFLTDKSLGTGMDSYSQTHGFSVRCLKNREDSPTS